MMEVSEFSEESSDDDEFFINETTSGIWNIDAILLLRTSKKSFSPQLLRSLTYGIVEGTNNEEDALIICNAIKFNCKHFSPNVDKNRKIYISYLFENFLFLEDHLKYSILHILKMISSIIFYSRRKKKDITVNEATSSKSSKSRSSKNVIKQVTSENLYDYIRQNYIGNPDLLCLPEFNFDEKKFIKGIEENKSKTTFKRICYALDCYTNILELVLEGFRNGLKQECLEFFKNIFNNNFKIPNVYFEEVCLLVVYCPEDYLFYLTNYLKVIYEFLVLHSSDESMSIKEVLCKDFLKVIKAHQIEKNVNVSKVIYFVEPYELRNSLRSAMN